MIEVNKKLENGVSVVIPFYNRSKFLKRLLDSIEIQTLSPEKIFIFAQNAALISRVFEKINGIEVIHIDDKNTGLSKARNLGLTYIADQGYLCSPIECSHYMGIL